MEYWLAKAASGDLGRERLAPDKETLFEREDPADAVYLVRKGAVEIIQRSTTGLSLVVKILAAPALFGHGEVLGRERRYLESVRTVGASELYRLPAVEFKTLTKTDPHLSFECLAETCAMFMVTARFEPSHLFGTDALLANVLLSYLAVAYKRTVGGHLLALKRTQSDLAGAIGAGERSVNRILATWKAAGWVSKRRGSYVVHQVAALARVAEGLLGSLVYPRQRLEKPPWLG